MKIQEKSKGSVSVLMTQERPGSTARGPQHVMIKLQIYNTSPHFGKGIVSMKNPNVHGDQYVTIQIQVPQNLNYSAKEKLHEYAKACGLERSNATGSHVA